MFKNILAAACLALAFSFTACSGVSDNVNSSVASSSDPSQQIMTFTIADLKAADKIATTNGDTVAATCYEYLIPKVQALQSAAAVSKASVAGAASFAEVQRGVTVQLNNAKAGLNVACAPLVLDTINTATQLVAKMGALTTAAATGGASLIPLAP